MNKRAFRILTMLCLTIGLLLTLATSANAVDLTTNYYISGSPGAYSVGRSAGGTEIGKDYATLAEALSACSSDWAEPGTPVIQLGSADSPLSVKRGDGALISATYTGAVNIEHASSTYGLWVGKDAPVELRDFTLTNSLEGIGGEYNAVYVYIGGKLTIGSGTNIIVKDGGAYNANPNALYNDGTVTINGDALLSIENKGRVITNCGTCTIGGNAEDCIDISASSSSGSILNFNSGILTIGTGTTVSSSAGLENYNIATISGGTLVSSKTTVKNDGRGTLYISGGTVRNTDTNGSSNALYNNSTAVVSGGVITSDSSCAILTMYRLTLKGDCQVGAPNGTAVGSNTNTKANSEIIIRENASITGKTTGVEASAANGSGGTSTLTITGGSISGNTRAVKTSANTEISGGTLSASGSSSTNSFALECSGGATVNISSGELIADSERNSAYGIYNKGSTVNFSGGSVVAGCTTSDAVRVYGIYNYDNATTNISGGSVTAKTDVSAPNALIYGLHNKNSTANITGGTISSEGSNNAAFAVYDEESASPKGVFIRDTSVLRSVSPNTVRLEKRATDSGALTYFGTSFYSNANAVVTIQGAQDEAAAAYVIDGSNFANAQACALPDAGYGSPRWTSDAERTNILSEASPASLSTLMAGGSASVYLSVKRIYTVTVNQGAYGTAGADVSSLAAGEIVTLTATPHYGYSFAGWTSASGVAFTDASAPNTTFTMPANAVAVTANWRANQYTVTFSPNGGSEVSPITQDYNTKITSAPYTGKPGYTFAGWFADEGLNTAVGFPYIIAGSTTLYAKWTPNTYTLTFDSNGGSAETAITAAYGDALTLPTPTRPNFAFSGWYESETGNNGSGMEFTAAAMPDLGADGTTKTLYAKWTAKEEIGYAPAPQSYTYGTPGAAYTVSHLSLSGFTVQYDADSAWTATPPTEAGSYNVRITRAEDTTYASYDSGTLDDHFAINPATLTVTIRSGLTITKAYDENATVDGVQSDWLLVNGLKNGETATAGGTWSYANADAGTGKAVNITGISITYGTASSGNYTYTPASLSTTGEITNASQPVTSVTINYAAEIADTTVLMEYSANGTDWTDCTADMVIASGWFGDNVYFRLKAKPNYDAGATQTLSIPARPTTPAATGTDETFFGQGNGSISGVSAVMEYKAGADGSWQNVTGTEPTGLTAGTYHIRVMATESSFKSLEQELILQNGPKLTVTFDAQGGSAVDSCTDLSYGTLLREPAAPTREGYTFAGWHKESTLENAWDFETDRVTANITVWAKWTRNPDDSEGTVTQQPKTITVTETSSSLFMGSEGHISASADMDKAFASSVEVKVTDTKEDKAVFGFAAGVEVYPFDISLYIKGTNQKTEPAAGYSVIISLPVPKSLLDVKDLISVVHKSGSGAVSTLASRLEQKNGAWYLTFEATEFSPYALVVRNAGSYDESAGVPYYLDAEGSRVFIGFAANGRYISPEGVSVYAAQNGKSFTDVSGHWAQSYIGFVTERELFLGTGGNAFSPDAGMTRAMFATVVGRLYERSYGEIDAPNTHTFTDCDYSDYYGKYVDWAAKNGIIAGYGNGVFGPDDSITREQMAAILYRFADFLRVLPNDMDATLDYLDAGSISNYAKDAALYCQTTGVIGGRTGGVFAPQETGTRAEVATIVKRFVESVVK